MNNASIDRRRAELEREKDRIVNEDVKRLIREIIADVYPLDNEAVLERQTEADHQRRADHMQKLRQLCGRYRGACESLKALG